MASYYSNIPVYVYDVRNEVPMSPEDIALISSIINQNMDEVFNRLLTRIEEEIKKEIITDEQFSNLKKNFCKNECPVCFIEKTDNIELNCNHIFCKSCIKRWLTEKCNSCPICREKAV